ncbi:MAG: hypothetical protein J0H94_12355 [Rhizobiales bacterium]|nr:hypothetical protein [Hyphomicrobiales bacterium]
MAGQTRREILAGVMAAIAAAGAVGFPAMAHADPELGVDQFLALSEKLTGKESLDAGVAAKLLGGFVASGKGDGLLGLMRGDDIDDELANAIVAAWYTGLYETGWGQAVSDFNGALVWAAMTYTKPWANCGGETGYWADPPTD